MVFNQHPQQAEGSGREGDRLAVPEEQVFVWDEAERTKFKYPAGFKRHDSLL
jgi:hypothetical protein